MNKLFEIQPGTKIEVDDSGGHGPIVVLIHGWPITSYHWRKIVPALHGAGYRTLMVTLRGLGGNSEGGGNLEKSTLAKEVRLLLEKLDVKNYSAIGHDWGATVAYLLSHYYSKNCWALVVEEEVLPGINVNIPYPGNNYYPKWHGPLNRAVGLAEELIEGRELMYYRRFLDESAGKFSLEDEAMSKYVFAYTDGKKVKSQLRDSLDYYRTKESDEADISSCLTTPLDIPVLAVAGKYAMGEAVKEGLNRIGTRLSGVVSESAGHYPIEQASEYCSPKILNFLEKSHFLKKNQSRVCD